MFSFILKDSRLVDVTTVFGKLFHNVIFIRIDISLQLCKS